MSFGNYGRGRRTSSGPKELVANSADDIPAVNILASAIIAADEAEAGPRAADGHC